MIRLRNFFEELFADLDQFRVSRSQVAENTERTADIVHRRGPTER